MKPPVPSKEQQLLFNLLKGEIPASLEGIDTGILFDLFRRHRLFPLASPVIPLLKEAEREGWKKAIRFRSLRSMQQLAACDSFVEAFRKEGLQAIPFKGPILAHTLFGDMAERHSSDLDILIRDDDTRRIIGIAGRLGYELNYPKAGLSDRQWRYYRRYKKDIGLHNKAQGIQVELHYSFENYLGLKSSAMEQFFRSTEEIRIGRVRCPGMNQHFMFLYLVMHGGVHQYRRLFWLRDVARALTVWDLDHRRVLSDAQDMGLERLLGVSLVLAGEFFPVRIPDAYGDYLQRDRKMIGRLSLTAKGFILGPEFPDYRGKLRHHLFMLRLKPRLSHYYRTGRELINRFYIGRFLGGH